MSARAFEYSTVDLSVAIHIRLSTIIEACYNEFSALLISRETMPSICIQHKSFASLVKK